MKYWFIREGNYKPSIHDDFMRVFGRMNQGVKISSAVRMDYTNRFMLNVNDDHNDRPYAISTFTFDRLNPDFSPEKYRSIDFDLISRNIDAYTAVFFGSFMHSEVVSERSLYVGLGYYGIKGGVLYNLETCEVVPKDNVLMAKLFVAFAVPGTPIAYIILDPNLLSVTEDSGLDLSHSTGNFHFTSADEPSIKSSIFTPCFDSTVKVINESSLYVPRKNATLTFNLIDPNYTGLKYGIPEFDLSVDSNFKYKIGPNTVKFELPANVTQGYVSVKVGCGNMIPLFQKYERWNFEYSVVIL